MYICIQITMERYLRSQFVKSCVLLPLVPESCVLLPPTFSEAKFWSRRLYCNVTSGTVQLLNHLDISQCFAPIITLIGYSIGYRHCKLKIMSISKCLTISWGHHGTKAIRPNLGGQADIPEWWLFDTKTLKIGGLLSVFTTFFAYCKALALVAVRNVE